MIVWLILLGIVLLFAVIVVHAKISEARTDNEIAETADWLETEATIQSAVMERLDKYTSFPSFAFSYSVKGEYFSGRFYLKADQEQSDDLIKTLPNQRFPVQYDPDDPSAWFIAENTIAGYEVIQNLSSDYPPDTGLYRSDGDAPIDLHIN
jgi:Protein of unknown function (DUF3592)